MRHSLTQLGFVVFCLSAFSIAQADPLHVYVYNRALNVFDSTAEGSIWEALGLLDGNGKPGTHRESDNAIVDGNGNVLGHAIVNGGIVVGYRNLDGSKEAYDLNVGMVTCNYAWLRVAAGGTFQIVKHGSGYTDREGAIHEGGGIALDDGVVFDGFKESGTSDSGTGAGYPAPDGSDAGAYPLENRDGANITVVLDGCYTSTDPDGKGPQKSVVQSVKDNVKGADASKVSGQTGTEYRTVSVELSGTENQMNAAEVKLEKAAKKAGCVDSTGKGDYMTWIGSLWFQDQYSTVYKIIKETGAGVKLEYPTSGGQTAVYGVPTMVSPSSGDFTYSPIDSGDLLSTSMTIESGDVAQQSMIDVQQLGELPAAAPDGLGLVSGIFDYRHLGAAPPLASDVDISLDVYFAGDLADVFPYYYDGENWLPYANYSAVALPSPYLVITTGNVGIVAAFAVPEPAALSLLGLAGLVLLRRRQGGNSL